MVMSSAHSLPGLMICTIGVFGQASELADRDDRKVAFEIRYHLVALA